MSSENAKQPFSYTLATTRIVACVAVILLHATVPVIFAHGSAGWLSWWLGMSINAAARVAVPLFVLISGALMLTKPLRPALQTISERFLRLLPLILFWVPFYLVFFHLTRGDAIHWLASAKRLIFSEQYEHLYFLFLLAQLTLFTPFLQRFVHEQPRKQLLRACITATALTILWQPKQFMPLLWVPYLSYFLWGAYIWKYRPRTTKSSLLVLSYVLSVIGIALGTRYLTARGTTDNLYLLRYTSPTVVVASLAAFTWTTRQSTVLERQLSARTRKHIRTLSQDTLSVYLIAPAIYFLLQQRSAVQHIGTAMALAIATIGISWLAVRLFRRTVYLLQS